MRVSMDRKAGTDAAALISSVAARFGDARLTIELVPHASWGENLRSLVPRDLWDRLRRETYRAARYRCQVCGGRGPDHPVECHESWAYNDTRHVQTLVGLLALCPSCHRVKHYGRAEVYGYAEQAFAHLMAVNGWPAERAADYVDAALDVWELRSASTWQVDLGWLNRHTPGATAAR